MGDKIVVMNHGVVEQFGRPQEIYDWPATTFVARFIGSPAMNLLPFDGMVGHGSHSVSLAGCEVAVPEMISGGSGALTFGVRPEHVHLSDSAAYKARVTATEYLGTTQIVTLDTPLGPVKSRIASDIAVRIGETTGLSFDARSISLFEGGTGRALISKANQKVLIHG
jgi:multiple sugar transport system ATP-binding protein